MPVDGDTYDMPLMIATGNARRKALGQPDPKFGHYEKFGSDPVKHRNFSAVNHVKHNKGIPPFLLLYVGNMPIPASGQASRFHATRSRNHRQALQDRDTEHSKINENLGLSDDPSTKAMFEFVEEVAKK